MKVRLTSFLVILWLVLVAWTVPATASDGLIEDSTDDYDAPVNVASGLAVESAGLETSAGQLAIAVDRAIGPSGDVYDPAYSFVAPSAARFCSFSGETEVLMAEGTTKPISEVEAGDWVLAEDPETGERGARQVTHLWVHQDTIIDLEIDGHDVATTQDHPFWNATDSEWQRADALDTGDLLVTARGATLIVDGMDWGSARTTTAYNLTVDAFTPTSSRWATTRSSSTTPATWLRGHPTSEHVQAETG